MRTHSRTHVHPRRLPLARRQALVLEALPTIQRTAAHLAYVYRSPRFDAEELTQIGALAVCEALQRGIKPRGNRTAYIIVIARRAMRRQMGVYRSLIKTPRTANGFQPALVVLSLDAPTGPTMG